MWSPSEESPPRTLMLDARGRWVSALEDPLPDLWIDAAPFFAALSQSTSVASDEGREKLSTENLSSDVVSPWTILKSPDGERAPPLEYAQHILADNEAVAQVAGKVRAWSDHAARLLARAENASTQAAGATTKAAARLTEQTRGLQAGLDRHSRALNEALFVAAARSNEKCVNALLAAGADPKSRDGGSLCGPSIARFRASSSVPSVGSLNFGPSKVEAVAEAGEEVVAQPLLGARMSALEMECSYLARRRRQRRFNSSSSANGTASTRASHTSSGRNSSGSTSRSSSSSHESLRLVAIVPDAPGQPSDFGWCVDLARRCRYDFAVAAPADTSLLEEATSDANLESTSRTETGASSSSGVASASVALEHTAPVVCTLPWNGMPASYLDHHRRHDSSHSSSESSDEKRGGTSGSSTSAAAASQEWVDYIETKLLAGAPGPALAKSAVLVGAGQGANAVLQVAARKPLLGLILVDPGYPWPRGRHCDDLARQQAAANDSASGNSGGGDKTATDPATSSAYSAQDSDSLLLQVDWLAVVKNVKHLFVLWTPNSTDAPIVATSPTDAAVSVTPDPPTSLDAGTTSTIKSSNSNNNNKTSAGAPPETVARVWKRVQAAMQGEQMDEDTPIAEQHPNSSPALLVEGDLAPAATAAQVISSCQAHFASTSDLTLSGASNGDDEGRAAIAVADLAAEAPLIGEVAQSAEGNRVESSSLRNWNLGSELRPCAPPGVLAAVRSVLRAHGGLTTYTPASTLNSSSSQDDDLLYEKTGQAVGASAATTKEKSGASAQGNLDASQAAKTKVEQKDGARAAKMSKILQKASKTAEAKRAQSGAHQAATSEVERCLSGELVIAGLRSAGGAKMNGIRGYCKGPLLKTGRLAFYASEGQGVSEGPYMVKPAHLRLVCSPHLAEDDDDDDDAATVSGTLEQGPNDNENNVALRNRSGAQNTENRLSSSPTSMVAAAVPPLNSLPPPQYQNTTREAERQTLEAAISAAQSPEDLAAAMAHVQAFQKGGKPAPPVAPFTSSLALSSSSSAFSSPSSSSKPLEEVAPFKTNKPAPAAEVVAASISPSAHNSQAFDLDSDFTPASATAPVAVAEAQWHSMDDFDDISDPTNSSSGDYRPEAVVAMPVVPEADANFGRHAVTEGATIAVGDEEAPVAVAWVAGQRVIVRGLVGRPELNGMRGCVEKYFSKTERFAVSLDGKKGRFQLKASNLCSEARIAEEGEVSNVDSLNAHHELTINEEPPTSVTATRSEEHCKDQEGKDEQWHSGASGLAHAQSLLENHVQHHAANDGGGKIEPLPASAMNLSLDDLCGGDLATNTSLNLNLINGGLNLDGGALDDNDNGVDDNIATERRTDTNENTVMAAGVEDENVNYAAGSGKSDSSNGSNYSSNFDGNCGGGADDAGWMSSTFDEAAVAKTESLARQLEEGSFHSQALKEVVGTAAAVPAGTGENGWQDLSSILAAQDYGPRAAATSLLPLQPETASRQISDSAPDSTPAAAAVTSATPAMAAGQETVPAPKSSERVVLCGLLRKPELNGCCGSVVSYCLSEDRFAVRLDDGRGPYKLKASNLQAAPPRCDTVEGRGTQDLSPHGAAEAVANEAADSTPTVMEVASTEENVAAAAVDSNIVEGRASSDAVSPPAQPYAGSVQMELLKKFYAKGNPENRRAVEEALRRRTSGK